MPFYILPFRTFYAPFYPLTSYAVIKSPREAHHTFESKLRNASTLLRLGKTKKSCFALTLIAKFTFQFSLFTFFFYLYRELCLYYKRTHIENEL